MRAIFVIGYNAFQEAIRRKIVEVLIVFSIVFIGSVHLLATFTPEEQIKLIQDVGLGGMAIFGALIAIFLGMSFIPQEVDKRTIYPLLSMPVRRGEVVVGKFLGGVFSLTLILGLMTAVFFIVLAFQHFFNPLILKAVLLLWVELVLLLAIAIMFSTFASSTISAAFTLFMYITGHLMSYLKFLGEESEAVSTKIMALIFYYLLPNLENFNVVSKAVNKQAIPLGLVGSALLYGLTYIIIFLLISIVIFSRKEV